MFKKRPSLKISDSLGEQYFDVRSGAEMNCGEVRSIQLLAAFRAIGCMVLIHFLHGLLELSPAVWLFDGAAILGCIFPVILLRQSRSLISVLLAHALLTVFLLSIFWLGEFSFSHFFDLASVHDFTVTRLADTVGLLFGVYVLSFLTSWLFWTQSHFLTIEVILGAFGFVWLLSGHRHYHTDAPKQVSQLAWHLHLAPEVFLLFLAGSFSAISFVYLFLATSRPIFSASTTRISKGKRQRFLFCLLPAVLVLFLVQYANYLQKNYAQDLSRASNGVGQENQEGKSPLGFHSAVGQTKQPAALVRLEGDYVGNPWSPMLYLREGALSEFNGHELVIADLDFDTDVPRAQPSVPYSISKPYAESSQRTDLKQSIFLIAEHSAPFAVDTPYDLRPLKNPDQKKFILAYQALSMAPNAPFTELENRVVGNPEWSKETWTHYLRAPGSYSRNLPVKLPTGFEEAMTDERNEDLRYLALAKMLARDKDSPIARASAIVSYLSEKSIYTRQPGHSPDPNSDPVAPYLFAKEKRGYCVHFAHAAVYLMRLAGIPARIATGYLTDLGYAKDGHILLQLGDRHAWPEVYLNEVGWVVVDVSPTQAENEQVSIPDEKLLDELMNSIDSVELLQLPPSDTSNSKESEEKVLGFLFDPIVAKITLSLVVICYVLIKLWLRLGYLIPRDPSRQTILAYRSFVTMMADLGYCRVFGESRAAFTRRLYETERINALDISLLYDAVSFGGRAEFSEQSPPREAFRSFLQSLKRSRLHRWTLLSFFSPSSLWHWSKR